VLASAAMRRAVVGAVLLAGCATSSAGVPRLQAGDLAPARFAPLTPRELRVEVEDSRDPAPRHSTAIVARIGDALRGRLALDGLTVRADAVHVLRLWLRTPERAMPGFRPSDCVAMRGELRPAGMPVVGAEGVACYAYHHAFGFSLGAPTRAYRTAVDFVIEKLEAQLAAP